MLYLTISNGENLPLKFLIDTGSNHSFINPELVPPDRTYKIDPITITTAFNAHTIDKAITFPCFKEFKQTTPINLILFKFHQYFDGLIGLDLLTDLNAHLDIKNNILHLPNTSIKLFKKPNCHSYYNSIGAYEKKLIPLPVDVKNNEFYVPKTQIKQNLFIAEGLYKSENWYTTFEVFNNSDKEQTFILEQPIKTYDLHANFLNCNFHIPHNHVPQRLEQTDNLNLLRTDHMNQEEIKAIRHIINQYADILFKEGDKLTFAHQVKHEIRTTDNLPIFTKQFRYPEHQKEIVREHIDKMLESGIIRESYSPWSSPTWLVPKKLDASGKRKWRLVVDFRKLNEKTIDDKYPIPNITDILDKLGKSMYFTALDLTSGFHQIELAEKDIEKTAFTVDHGHFEYVRMPLGLKNSPATFQRIMDNVLKDLLGKCCLVYLDDIIIYSTSLQEHIESIKKVFDRLRRHNLKIQLDKCEFLKHEVKFLGHTVTQDGVRPNNDKIKAILNYPLPTTEKQIKSFLGLLGYYRKFINNFAKLTKPLTQCLRKEHGIKITDEFKKCFNDCRHILMNEPILQFPDFTKPFILTTDASNVAIGAVLSQGPVNSDKPVCYASRTLTKTEQNYSTIEKELLAIVWAVKYFRPYLYGRKFQILTDHRPLTWLMNLKDPNSKLIRWRLKLEEYQYDIVYKKGKINTNADALSRIEINFNESDRATNNDSDINTIHSNEENITRFIPISEKPINYFPQQVILKLESKTKNTLQILYKTHKRRIIHKNIFDEQTLIELIKQFVNPNKQTAILTDDVTFKTITSLHQRFFNHYKLIRCMKLINDVTSSDEQDKLISDYHDKSNHRGITETLEHLKRDYYFPNLKSKITHIINSCDVCLRTKYERHPPKIKFEITQTPTRPNEFLHIDIYSIQRTPILTTLDKFSKFGSAYALNTRNSKSVCESLLNYFSHHGIPKEIVTDNGSEFTGIIFKDFCKLHNITQHVTCTKSSTGNSPVERYHSTITELCRIIYDKDPQLSTTEILHNAVLSYNNAIHSSTKYTPFEIQTGKIYLEPLKQNEIISETEYINTIKRNYQQINKNLHDKMHANKTLIIERLNENRNDPPSVDPEQIYELDNRRNKLANRYQRTTLTKENKITIETPKSKVHKGKLKPFRSKLQVPTTSKQPDNRVP